MFNLYRSLLTCKRGLPGQRFIISGRQACE